MGVLKEVIEQGTLDMNDYLSAGYALMAEDIGHVSTVEVRLRVSGFGKINLREYILNHRYVAQAERFSHGDNFIIDLGNKYTLGDIHVELGRVTSRKGKITLCDEDDQLREEINFAITRPALFYRCPNSGEYAMEAMLRSGGMTRVQDINNPAGQVRVRLSANGDRLEVIDNDGYITAHEIELALYFLIVPVKEETS